MPIRVLFLQSQSFFAADTELHAQLMRYFDREQVEVHVACTDARHANSTVDGYQRILSIPDLRIRSTHFGPSSYDPLSKTQKAASALRGLASISALTGYIKRHHIDIVHATDRVREAYFGVKLAKWTRTKSVLHMHINYHNAMSPRVLWALRHADVVIGVSDFTRDSIVAAGIPAQRVHTVLNSLDLESNRWDPDMDGQAIRQELGIPATAVVLGIVSRLFLYKGHADLLAAIALARERMPEYRLVVVGADAHTIHPGGGSFTEELKAQARELGISDNIIFTGFRTDIPALMSSFDIYTMPSWEEPFGMVFVEAMAMRKPVIALAMAGPAAIVVDKETGLLVEPKNIPALAEALVTLAQDAPLRARFGAAGRQRVEKHFVSQRMCKDVLEVYKQILPHL